MGSLAFIIVTLLITVGNVIPWNLPSCECISTDFLVDNCKTDERSSSEAEQNHPNNTQFGLYFGKIVLKEQRCQIFSRYETPSKSRKMLVGLVECTEMHPNMMTSSNGNIFRVTGHLCGEFIGHGEFPPQRPVTRSFDVFFDLRLNEKAIVRLVIWEAIAPIMTSL